MSVPKTLQALPAKARFAVKVLPCVLREVALYPGHASKMAESMEVACTMLARTSAARGSERSLMMYEGCPGVEP